MDVTLTPYMVKRYANKQNEITQKLEVCKLAPNNSQYACAVACVSESKRTFLAVPSGQGKSRVIATVIALLSEMRFAIKFAILFPNRLLAEVNRADFEYLDR